MLSVPGVYRVTTLGYQSSLFCAVFFRMNSHLCQSSARSRPTVTRVTAGSDSVFIVLGSSVAPYSMTYRGLGRGCESAAPYSMINR
jgi:hypothetical protein